MNYSLAKLIIIYFLFLLLITTSRECLAQQSIIIIPSTDTAAAGKTSIKTTTTFRPFRAEFIATAPTITQGLGFNTEVYLGVPIVIKRNTVFNDFDSNVNLNFGIKKAAVLTKTTRIAIGTQMTPSLQIANTPRNFTYIIISQQLPKTGSKFTSGMYLRNGVAFMPSVHGVLLGFEQSIIKNKLAVAADWTSRNEPYGLLGTGLIFKPNVTTTIKSGVLIPNGSKSVFAFIVSISKTF